MFVNLIQYVLVTLSLGPVCLGAALKARSDKTVAFNFEKSHGNAEDDDFFDNYDNELESSSGAYFLTERSETQHGQGKRDTVSAKIKNEKTYYSVVLELGSHKQKSKILIDTGSSDLWVVESDATCIDVDCKKAGTYSPQKSSTFTNLSQPFSILYADGTSGNGTFVKDTVKIGNASVKQQEFAVATSSSSDVGVLGIGLTSLESTVDNSTYDNLPISMKKQGFIDKVAYSIFLNKRTSKSGTVLFGGIDHAKYYGNLVELPITSKTDITVPFEGVTFNSQVLNNYTNELLLDIGSSFSYLPKNIIEGIAEDLNGTFSEELETYIVDCDLRRSKENISFNFAKGVNVTAPLSDFIITVKQYNAPNKRSEENTCIFSIFDDEGYPSMGDDFLRNAYLYYNLEGNTVGIAPVKFTKKSSIQNV